MAMVLSGTIGKTGILSVLLWTATSVAAQSRDSLSRHAWADRLSTTRSYRMTYVAVPLIAAGVVVSAYDRDFRRLRDSYAPQFRYHYDDYLQYTPATILVGMKACGVESRSSWGRTLVSDALSAGIMAQTVNSLKYSCRVMRPDGISRQLNNKHWMSDVMVGAGIGILATELGYFLADLIFRERGLYICEQMVLYDRYRRPSFVSLSMGVAATPGSYSLPTGGKFMLRSGPIVSVSGAFFVSPYVGIGGRLSVTDLEQLVDCKPQESSLRDTAALGRVYGSYPFSARWLAGGRFLCGCGFQRNERYATFPKSGREGFAFAAGLNSTFLATQNLGVRFFADYDCAPPPVAGIRKRLNLVNFSLEACAVF